jgi:hypothetical protein
VYDRARRPFCETFVQSGNFTAREEKELRELQSDHTLNMRLTDLSLDMSWIFVKEGYPAIREM